MPAPLSIDLRERVIAAVEAGMRKTEAAKIFNVERKSVYNWLGLKKSTNSLEPKSGYQKGHSHKIKDLEAFKKFVDSNIHDSAKTIAIKLGNVSKATVAKVLKQIGYTKKKRRLVTKNKNKMSEKNLK